MHEPFTKLMCSILDSSIWDADHATRVVWITLLAMADAEGYVGASVGGIARRARVTREEALAALELFQAPDPDSRDDANEGRRLERVHRGWQVLNYAKIRAADDYHEREKERKREWWRKNRAQSQASAASASGSQLASLDGSEAESDPDRDPDLPAAVDPKDLNRSQRTTTPPAEQRPRRQRNHEPGVGPPARERVTQAADEAFRAPTSFDEAMLLPVQVRAAWCVSVDGRHRAEFVEPHRWPEVLAVARLVRVTTLAPWPRDKGVQRVVELLATFPEADLLRAVQRVVRGDWWRSDRRGLSSLSVEVVRREIESGPSRVGGVLDKALAEARAEAARENGP